MDPIVVPTYDVDAPMPDGASRKKFIRTYARDMEIVQRGGTPDLAPLGQLPPAAQTVEPPIQAQPAPQPARAVPEAAPGVSGALPALEHDATVAPSEAVITTYEQGLREATERAREAVPASPAAVSWQASGAEREAVLARLREKALSLGLPTEAAAPPAREPSLTHTYTTDFSSRMQETRASRAAIIAAESDAKTGAPLPSPQTAAPSRNRRYVIGAIALVVVGSGALFAAYVRYVANTGPVMLVATPATPVFVDEREEVRGEGATLMGALQGSVGHPLREGGVRLVYDPSATTTALFNALLLPAPGTLLRNVNAEGSMAGVVAIGGVQSPFFILGVASYGDTFAGMLTWESSMLRALAPLYPAYPAGQAAAASTTAPSITSLIAPPPPDQGFVDQVVANHDARVYRDGAGRSVIIYGYWDQTTLVIARDEAAFTAILERLATSRTR